MSAMAPLLPDPSRWQAQYMRLIAFPTEPHASVEQQWWQDLTGLEVESSLRKKHERADTGLFQGVSLALEIDLLRVVWTASPRIDAGNPPEQLPTLGPFLERREWFQELMSRWLQHHCPPIKRLAFASELIHPVDDHRSAYLLLDQYLRKIEVDPDTSDFLYRINRRTPSSTGIPNLFINRLTTWTAGQYTIEIRAGLAGQQWAEADRAIIQKKQYFCALALDINTIPDFPGGVLPHDELSRIFNELVNLGVAIATQGDANL